MNVAVLSTLVEFVASPTHHVITQVVEVHEPIVSAAQGPQGTSRVPQVLLDRLDALEARILVLEILV